MAYPFPAPMPARVRPGPVTTAAYLMYAVAGAQALMALLAVATLGTLQDAYEEAIGSRSAGTVAVVVGIVLNVVAIAIFATLGLLIGKGKNAARIVMWCVVGPALLCFGAQFARGSSTPVRISNSTSGGSLRVDEVIAEHMPGWATAAALMLTIVSFAAAATVIVLVALPPANAYFRKPPVYGFHAPPGYPIPPHPPQAWHRPPSR